MLDELAMPVPTYDQFIEPCSACYEGLTADVTNAHKVEPDAASTPSYGRLNVWRPRRA
jgi:hypothetical protein